jgi:hypothetical protein
MKKPIHPKAREWLDPLKATVRKVIVWFDVDCRHPATCEIIPSPKCKNEAIENPEKIKTTSVDRSFEQSTDGPTYLP